MSITGILRFLLRVFWFGVLVLLVLLFTRTILMFIAARTPQPISGAAATVAAA